jgi:hypothetical protein
MRRAKARGALVGTSAEHVASVWLSTAWRVHKVHEYDWAVATLAGSHDGCCLIIVQANSEACRALGTKHSHALQGSIDDDKEKVAQKSRSRGRSDRDEGDSL